MVLKPNEIDGRSIVNCDETSDVVQTLLAEVSAIREQQTALTETIERQSEQIASLQAELERKDDRIDDLENEVRSYREENERDKAEIRQEVTENTRQTEETSAHTEAVARKVETIDGGTQRTPLEQIVRLPDEILHRAKLTANQRRARTVAMDIDELATTVPSGKRLDSTTIKERLEREYGSAHDQTVARVMSFLDRLGGDRTELVHTGKGKAVIVDDWLSRQLRSAEQFATETIDRVLTNVVSVTTGTGG